MTNEKRVLLGLEKPFWTVVATNWVITSDLRRCGYQATEANFWHVLLPLLIDRKPYTAFISTKLLWLSDSANSDRAAIYSLCRTFPDNKYIIWSHGDWEYAPHPENLFIWSGSTKEVTLKLIDTLENGAV